MSVILATGSYDQQIKFWEAPSGKNPRTVNPKANPVNCLEITPNKQFLAAGCNPDIHLFEINDTSNPNSVLTLQGHSMPVTSIGFQKNVQYLYSGSEDGTVKIFDLRGPHCSRSFDCKSPVNSVAHHPTRNEIISGDQNGTVKVWDLTTSKVINEIDPDSFYGEKPSCVRERVAIRSVDFSDDGTTCIAANSRGHVFMWDPSDSTNFSPLSKFRAHPAGAYLLKAKISPDCRQLVTCSSDRTAKIFDITRNDNNGFQPPQTLELAQVSTCIVLNLVLQVFVLCTVL